MIQLKKLLKRVPLVVKTKRLAWGVLGLDNPSSPLRDPEYFIQQFKSTNEKSVRSLDMSRGLTRGRFHGVDYLLKMTPGNLIETTVFEHGVWDRHLLELIASYIEKPNQVVLDIGANVGATCIPLAKRYPGTHFYLFEPHPQVFSDLTKNCAFNQLSNVELINAAVSYKRAGPIKFYAQK